ncbi:MAG: hypothetical protein R3C11_11700 [Planctomycetaceae bacterium]
MLGHYEGGWNNRLDEVDWDDVGSSINVSEQYLLHLSIDGDTATLSVNGLPVVSGTYGTGIASGTAGVAAYNAETLFDDLEIATEVTTGTSVPFPYMEDFDDGVADNFYYNNAFVWNEINVSGEKVLRGNTSYNTELATAYVPVAGLPQAFDISAKVKSLYVGQGWQNAFLIFDYKGENDFKYAGMFTGQNEWFIGHYQGNWNNRLSEVDWDDTGRTIYANRYYNLRVHLDGATATLDVGDELITSATFASDVNVGPVGVAAERAFVWIDDFKVTSPPTVLDSIFEDFDDQLADDLSSPNSSLWNFVDQGGSDFTYTADSNPTNNTAKQLTDPNYILPGAFSTSVSLRMNTAAGSWLDGFIIFDYQNENDFKYAGAFAGQNQWVIGHYEGHWGNKVAITDWDDQSMTIDAGTFYDLELFVDGDTATLHVGGSEVVSATFNEQVNGGRIGFGAHNALTDFDDFAYSAIV